MTEKPIEVKVEMLIRKPVADVFEAVVNPDITSQFWFTKSSGRLEEGKQVTWTWEMYGVSSPVTVKELEPNQRLLIEWSTPPNTVEWLFTDRQDGTTYLTIINSGFTGTPDEIVAQALDSTGGFTFVICGLKALLEHNIRLNVTADHAPDHLVAGWQPAAAATAAIK